MTHTRLDSPDPIDVLTMLVDAVRLRRSAAALARTEYDEGLWLVPETTDRPVRIAAADRTAAADDRGRTFEYRAAGYLVAGQVVDHETIALTQREGAGGCSLLFAGRIVPIEPFVPVLLPIDGGLPAELILVTREGREVLLRF